MKRITPGNRPMTTDKDPKEPSERGREGENDRESLTDDRNTRTPKNCRAVETTSISGLGGAGDD